MDAQNINISYSHFIEKTKLCQEKKIFAPIKSFG